MVRQKNYLKHKKFDKGFDPRRNTQGRQKRKQDEPVKRAVRLTKNDFEDVVSLDPKTNMFTAGAHEKLLPPSIVLRPGPAAPQAIDKYLESAPDLEARNVNRLLNLVSTENLFNESFAEHAKLHGSCNGRLIFNMAKEIRWGTGVRESLKCTNCSYQSKRMRLYDTIQTKNKFGAKAAKSNAQVQAALFSTGIGNSDLRHVFVGLNASPPSLTGMQLQRNSVAEHLDRACDSGFKKTRRHINDVKEALGLPRKQPIPVEMDTRYNNPLWSGTGRTPGQPATQAVATACENFTKKKKVVAVHTANKHCAKAKVTKSRNNGSECPHHSGRCTATMSQTAVIGDEKLYASSIGKSLLDSDDPLNINYITTDGDSQMFHGVEEVASGEVINLRDTRHLSERMRKRIEASDFSNTMFPGRTKRLRAKCLKRFALDVQKRVQTEFSSAYRAANGDTDKLIRSGSFICDAIVSCYNGDHSICRLHSFVCTKGKPWISPFMADDQLALLIEGRDEKLLREALNMRLGREGIKMQRLNTSTQKCESVNRAYLHTNPKAVLNMRNFPVQVKTAAACLNDGLASTTAVHFEEIGAPLIPGSTAVKALVTETERKKYHAKRQRTQQFKRQRVTLAVKKYRNYDINAEAGTYKSGMADDEQCKQTEISTRSMGGNTRSKGGNKVDHTYPKLL